MARVTGSVISRIREGTLNLDVNFQYEAEYEYEVADRPLFERNTGGNPPAALLDSSVTDCFQIAFARAYPDGLSSAEMEQPNVHLLMQNLKPLLDDQWMRFCGLTLSAFSLRSFRADPPTLALIRQFRSVPKTPQQTAQQIMGATLAAMGAAASCPQSKCDYCGSVTAPAPDGSCPACGAPLR